MKKHFYITLCLLFTAGVLFIIPAWAAFEAPDYNGYVTDLADIMTDESEQTISSISEELWDKTSSQIAVLTLDSLEGSSIEEASLQTFRKWGIGSKEKNTGLLILVAVKDRKLRIEVGYGLEGIITDGTAGEIRSREMVPEFKAGNYDKGILRAVVASAQLIANANKVELESLSGNYGNNNAYSKGSDSSSGSLFDSPFIILLILLPFLIPLLFSLLVPFLGLSSMLPSRDNHYGGYGGGWGGGGFGSGGGFGGFGGGDCGGGGASGGW